MNLAEKQRKKRNKQVPLVDEQFFHIYTCQSTTKSTIYFKLFRWRTLNSLKLSNVWVQNSPNYHSIYLFNLPVKCYSSGRVTKIWLKICKVWQNYPFQRKHFPLVLILLSLVSRKAMAFTSRFIILISFVGKVNDNKIKFTLIIFQ